MTTLHTAITPAPEAGEHSTHWFSLDGESWFPVTSDARLADPCEVIRTWREWKDGTDEINDDGRVTHHFKIRATREHIERCDATYNPTVELAEVAS